MRAPSHFALPVIVGVTVLLAGCTAASKTSGFAEPESPTDLCAVAAPAGPLSDSVSVEGPVGVPAVVSLPEPLAVTSLERTVVVEGEGDPLTSTSLVDYAVSAYDAATGVNLWSEGYEGPATPPVAATAVGDLLGCVPVGSRIVATVPETDQEGASVWVIDVLDAKPAWADGSQQEPIEGMPAVELAEGGSPSITVPAGEPPTETQVAVLKKGDGAVVSSGDSVTVHYSGVRWSDGTIFDSSWSKQSPTVLVPVDLIPGYHEAIEGQAVGSQVLVVIPPHSAYGEGEINEDDLTGETLVFVIDILDAQPAA